jgi:5-methylcytosine-specific restriction endonuclease McrA
MGRRNWGKKTWSKYHLNKFISKETENIRNNKDVEIIPILQKIEKLKKEIESLERNTGLGNKFFGSIGINNYYNTRKNEIYNQISGLEIQERRIRNKYYNIIQKEEQLSQEKYYLQKEKKEIEKIERKEETKIKKIEHSKDVRGTQKSMKNRLVRDSKENEGYIKCYYCNKKLEESETEIEHKTPVSRGGRNKRSNVVLSCKKCNREKGRKNEKEFNEFRG